jgi:NADH-quinone oxidoreductase subunit N
MSPQLVLAAAHHINGPHIDWRALSPIVVLAVGGLVVLLVGLFRPAVIREWIVPSLAVLTFLCTIAACIVAFNHHPKPPTHAYGFCVAAGPGCATAAPLSMDRLALELIMLFSVAGVATVLMSWRGIAVRESGHGEFYGLLIFSALGMSVFVAAQNLITLFLGIEMLSIPLYILCASETRREGSLESGLKYLVVGSVGSATLVYGLALIYGATGSTDFTAIGSALSVGKLAGGGTAMVFTGLALTIVGFAFKASVAPFHQWTPDVYEGAPTPVTAFMATATKAAALGAFLRFFDVAAIGAQNTWAPLLATLAAITIIVGNVGALNQTSLKRILGYSGVAQAGYMLSGVVVGSRLGIQATMFYLFGYLFMNMAAFAVIVAEEHERPDGDYLSALAGLGSRRPWLAWPMTIAMLGLAGIPGTIGFIGKFQLIEALVSGDYTWLAIVLVIGSMISLGYYLRVVAALWMRPSVAAPVPVPAAGPAAGDAGELAPIAGGSLEADEWDEGPGAAGASFAYPEVVVVAVGFAAAVIFFGIFPTPLFNLAAHAANAIGGLF